MMITIGDKFQRYVLTNFDFVQVCLRPGYPSANQYCAERTALKYRKIFQNMVQGQQKRSLYEIYLFTNLLFWTLLGSGGVGQTKRKSGKGAILRRKLLMAERKMAKVMYVNILMETQIRQQCVTIPKI